MLAGQNKIKKKYLQELNPGPSGRAKEASWGSEAGFIFPAPEELLVGLSGGIFCIKCFDLKHLCGNQIVVNEYEVNQHAIPGRLSLQFPNTIISYLWLSPS